MLLDTFTEHDFQDAVKHFSEVPLTVQRVEGDYFEGGCGL
jgi:hypothetical protein